jgi:choline dehydrogenase-like flavoprotein
MFPSWFSKQAFRTSTCLFYPQTFSQSLYSNEGVLASQIPLLAPTLTPYTLYDWNYTTTAQPGFNGRSIPYPRGRLLGGSSSVSKSSYRLSS